MSYMYIAGTILLTVYGQLILKWRIVQYGSLPEAFAGKVWFLLKLFLDPFILSGFLSAFGASLFWMATMTKLDVSYAYPFMSGAFILVLIFSTVFFNEPLTWQKLAGLLLIISGILVSSQSE